MELLTQTRLKGRDLFHTVSKRQDMKQDANESGTIALRGFTEEGKRKSGNTRAVQSKLGQKKKDNVGDCKRYPLQGWYRRGKIVRGSGASIQGRRRSGDKEKKTKLVRGRKAQGGAVSC